MKVKDRLNYQHVPPTQADDCNRAFTTWRGGRCVAVDEGSCVTLFVGHHDGVDYDIAPDGTETARPAVLAFGVRVPKPVTRDMAINAAEMSAYGLKNAMEVASFNASLGRKYRADSGDAEVAEHDEFIAWVKDELTRIGL